MGAIYAYARREIAGWGKQGRKLAGEVVVADALAPEAARRAQRQALLAAARDSLPELPCVCVFAYHPATLLLLRAGYLAGGGQLQAALLRSDCGCRRRGFASPQSSPREEWARQDKKKADCPAAGAGERGVGALVAPHPRLGPGTRSSG